MEDDSRDPSALPVPGERLQKALAEAGVASRRAAEEMIRQGRVSVNGRVVTLLGTRVGPHDEIAVDGRAVERDTRLVYMLLHKPAGYVSTARDTHDRPTVLDLVPSDVRIYPVGRLDADSEGLMLLTNDGDLAYQVTHPRYALPKEYLVQVEGQPSGAALEKLRAGVWLEDRPTMPAEVTRMPTKGEARGEGTWLRFVIREGRNREIRRMCAAAGLKVRRLVRTGIGPLKLGGLAPGRSRFLAQGELAQLKRVASASAAPPAIAIDGPAASGKSALAQRLAQCLGWMVFDTGALYRALTVLAHRRDIDVRDEFLVAGLARQARPELVRPEDPASVTPRIMIDGEDMTDELYSPAVDSDVSAVAANPEVRQALLPRQREIANQGKVVVVGRDIGTVVLPGARLKVYLEASPEVRARRRAEQFAAGGTATDYEALLADLWRRDQQDRDRPNAPLAKAADAVVLHTDQMTLDEEVKAVLDLARQRFPVLRQPVG